MQCSIVTMSQENVLSRTFLVILTELLELILNNNRNRYSTEIWIFKFRIDAAKKLLSWNIYIMSAISINWTGSWYKYLNEGNSLT